MHRFYFPKPAIPNNLIIVEDNNEAHHIRDVLRLKPGEPVIIFDDEGREYTCVIDKVSRNITLAIKSMAHQKKGKKMRLTIACAIPKKSKMSDIIDKLTQLGVDEIIPLMTERVIVRVDEKKKGALLLRWQRIAQSASEQSKRRSLPLINRIEEIRNLITHSSAYDLRIIPALFGERKNLKEVLSESKAKNILALIGPEGDFTVEEVRLAIKHGFISVTLGEEVLRVETAAVAVASFVRLYYEDH
ncbi:MAG: RsmE family RNA methyltransferase [Candidatus Omnitrophota bacterium]